MTDQLGMPGSSEWTSRPRQQTTVVESGEDDGLRVTVELVDTYEELEGEIITPWGADGIYLRAVRARALVSYPPGGGALEIIDPPQHFWSHFIPWARVHKIINWSDQGREEEETP